MNLGIGNELTRLVRHFEDTMNLKILACSALIAGASFSGVCYSADEPADADPHAHHRHMMEEAPPVRRNEVAYQIPDVRLVRDDGKSMALRDVLSVKQPVILAFIYTSCTTVCPLTSQTLAQVQNRLGKAKNKVRIVSVSIDPEQDTPQKLTEYARTFHADTEWRHYTGTLAASQATQRAFDVYRGNKMNHAPAIFVRRGAKSDWIRFDGFATADQVVAELPDLDDVSSK
jgi:protein SCO1/2